MTLAEAHSLNERFTHLSDRFRSLWTFYQFLGGVFKHLERGEVPYRYDFQDLYKWVQEIAPRLATASGHEATQELDDLDAELTTVRRALAEIDADLPPSLVRRFFDKLQRQDERILSVLSKFYLDIENPGRDVLDKLDILLTRLASAPLDDGRVIPKDKEDLRQMLGRLMTGRRGNRLDTVERSALIQAVRDLAGEIADISEFEALLTCGVLDRLRELKEKLGLRMLDPALMVEVISSNITARNRFEELYREEESRILEDTNRIFEIERYIEQNPGFATPELTEQIATFRRFRTRYDHGRKVENIKREDVLELRRAMNSAIDQFDRLERKETIVATTPRPAVTDVDPIERSRGQAGAAHSAVENAAPEPSRPWPADSPPSAAPELDATEDFSTERASKTMAVDELLPPDPLLSEAIHKIIFSLELIDQDDSPEDAVHARELHNLRLNAWEIVGYRRLKDPDIPRDSRAAELGRFYLSTAALRIKMEEETSEIERLSRTGGERLEDLLEHAARSLERARDVERRFQWFIEDCLYQGETEELEQLHHSRFRFLNTYSRLWLDHRSAGGSPPL